MERRYYHFATTMMFLLVLPLTHTINLIFSLIFYGSLIIFEKSFGISAIQVHAMHFYLKSLFFRCFIITKNPSKFSLVL